MIKAIVFDLDGTLYVGNAPIAGVKEKLVEFRKQGKKVLFLTNSATRSRANLLEKINTMGFGSKKDEVYSSSYLLANYIAEKYPQKTVFVVGETGIAEECQNSGITIVDQKADIVVVGLDRTLTYEKLAKALGCLNNGAILIGANSDPTYPTETGLKPGAGSIIAAIECASGKKAHIVGKPNIYALEIIEKEHGLKANEILVVGDRLGTDIKFANDCGAKSALVLSGVSKKEDIKEIKPNYILDSVLDIQTQHLI